MSEMSEMSEMIRWRIYTEKGKYDVVDTYEGIGRRLSPVSNYFPWSNSYKKRSFLGSLVHRDDGPAIIGEDGTREWWSNGVLHREDGPAIDGPLATKYYLHGLPLAEEELHSYNQFLSTNLGKILQKNRHMKTDGWVDGAGCSLHFKDGVLHNENGPAVKHYDGSEAWFQAGCLHREIGPAIKWENGDIEFWKSGVRHRSIGPALVFADGRSPVWWQWGERLSEFEIDELLEGLSDKKVECTITLDGIEWRDRESGKLHHEHGPAWIEWDGSMTFYKNGVIHNDKAPAVMSASGLESWYKNGYRHREGGPALTQSNGTKVWYNEGKRHREEGPAVEFSGGRRAWYLDGERMSQQAFDFKTNEKKEREDLVRAIEGMINDMKKHEAADIAEQAIEFDGFKSDISKEITRESDKVFLDEMDRISKSLHEFSKQVEEGSVELKKVKRPKRKIKKSHKVTLVRKEDTLEDPVEPPEEGPVSDEIGWGIPLASLVAATFIGLGKKRDKQKEKAVVAVPENEEIAA